MSNAVRHGTIIERVRCYVGQLVNTTGCKVVRVGGVNDHVHILFLLSRDVAISHVLFYRCSLNKKLRFRI